MVQIRCLLIHRNRRDDSRGNFSSQTPLSLTQSSPNTKANPSLVLCHNTSLFLRQISHQLAISTTSSSRTTESPFEEITGLGTMSINSPIRPVSESPMWNFPQKE